MWDGGTVIARDGGGCRIRWDRHTVVGKGMVSGGREWHGCRIRWGRHVVVGKGAVSSGREWRGCRIGGDAMLRWEALQGHGEASWWTPTLCTYVVVEIDPSDRGSVRQCSYLSVSCLGLARGSWAGTTRPAF